MRIIFGDHALDIDRRELSLRGEPVSVAPQVFDLLVYLVRNRDRVVSKDDLIEAVWGGRIVSESALTTRINAVRRAIGDTGAKQSLIRTVARRGIRFVGKVHNEDEPLRADRTGEPAPQLGPLGPPEKASIAVLPFANLSGDPGQEYFVDGMVEEIITALSRIQWLLVIARNSSFTYKGQIVNVKQVGHELGVRYVLEGSVRKVGQRLRITAQLIDAINGAHLWADRFDGSLDDIFDIQDKVATNVADVIEPTLQTAEMVRSVNRPTNDLTAYDFYLRGYATYVSAARQNADALRLFEQAITRDPRYGPALAWAGVCCARLLLDGRSEDAARDRLKGTDFARRSLEVAGDDPTILANAPYALAYFGEDIGAMLAFVSRSLSLNPSFLRADGISAVFYGYMLANSTPRLNTPKPHYGSVRGLVLVGRSSRSARHIFTLGASRKRFRNCCSRCKRTLASPTHIGISRPAMPIWGASMKRGKYCKGCSGLPKSSCPTSPTSGTPNTASFTDRVFASP